MNPRRTSSRRLLRWSAPVVAGAAIAAVTLMPRAFAASPHPGLPARTAAQLLAAVQNATVQALSGTISTTARLGIPEVPSAGLGAAGGWTTLLAGKNTIRVWADGADRQRLALLGTLSETTVVHNGTTVWVYASYPHTATRYALPAQTDAKHASAKAEAVAPEQQLTPQQQAAKAIAAIDPTTSITVDRTARVAGRPAYQLVLTPRTTATLIQQVRIAIDAAKSVPLRVQVYARGHTAPAFETAFTSVSFAKPAASAFRFTPPRGAKVDQQGAIGAPASTNATDKPAESAGKAKAAEAQPRTIGTGWTSILALPAGTLSLDGTTKHDKGGSSNMLNELLKPVAAGRVLETRLLSVLVTTDGRVFVGAVPASALENAAAAHL
jgi:outer membrane lipoprotein-sorting protein